MTASFITNLRKTDNQSSNPFTWAILTVSGREDIDLTGRMLEMY